MPTPTKHNPADLRGAIQVRGDAVPPLTNDEIDTLARPYPMRDLLDLYAEAERGGETEVAATLRWLIDGRLALIESWSMGSSIVCAGINGRRFP